MYCKGIDLAALISRVIPHAAGQSMNHVVNTWLEHGEHVHATSCTRNHVGAA
jgi:hypothetical protein